MCKRTMYKRARIPMFLWERRACSNSGAQAVFPRPRKNGLGTRLIFGRAWTGRAKELLRVREALRKRMRSRTCNGKYTEDYKSKSVRLKD